MGPMKKIAEHKNEIPTAAWKEWKKEKAERKKKKEEKLLASLDQKQEEQPAQQQPSQEEVNIGRKWTVSIALPGNILDNAQTPELKTALAGQIARAMAIFNVDEVVVFDENGSMENEDEDMLDLPQCCLQLARILQYLECPQYLRKYFFPVHTDLRFAGLLNPLDTPHHYRRDEKAQFREGYVTEKTKKSIVSMVDVGLQRPLPVDALLTPGLRVTVEIIQPKDLNPKKLTGKVVSPATPQLRTGTYWGYTVRLANSLGAVFTQSPYTGGYDLLIGTSERGKKVPKKLPLFQHVLIAFGGLRGLEQAVESDTGLDVQDPSVLFDCYVNTCPSQGSRTIRTEEALLVTLAALQPILCKANKN